jgi:alpha-mannosidase
MLAVAAMQELMSYPAKDLLEVMRDLAFAEFHDTLPGTSIQNVEDAAIRLMDHGMEILSRHKAQAFFALASGQPPAVDGEIPVLVYNPHPWPVRGVFECEFMLADQNWKDEFTIAKVWRDGVELPTQIEKELSNLTMDWRKRVVFVAELKPGQMNRFDCKLEITPARPKPQLQAKDGSLSFDNGVMQVEINTTTGLLDRYAVNGVDLLKPGACRLLVITDDEDPWGMKVQDFRRVEGAFALMSREEGSRFSGLRPGTLRGRSPVSFRRFLRGADHQDAPPGR